MKKILTVLTVLALLVLIFGFGVATGKVFFTPNIKELSIDGIRVYCYLVYKGEIWIPSGNFFSLE